MTDTMTIGQLADRAGVNPRTLRYYERIGLLIPSSRTASGYRLYARAEADRLAFIRRAQALGLSLAEISGILVVRDGGSPPCPHVRALAESKVEEIDARVAEFLRLKADMLRLAEAARGAEPACAGSSSICVAFEESARSSP